MFLLANQVLINQGSAQYTTNKGKTVMHQAAEQVTTSACKLAMFINIQPFQIQNKIWAKVKPIPTTNLIDKYFLEYLASCNFNFGAELVTNFYAVYKLIKSGLHGVADMVTLQCLSVANFTGLC